MVLAKYPNDYFTKIGKVTNNKGVEDRGRTMYEGQVR
jgi:hypothetical protein